MTTQANFYMAKTMRKTYRKFLNTLYYYCLTFTLV